MSAIVLSSSVRQNLLSLQSTADLLATTQSRLSTGKKVNTALDNPTNYFTAASLDSPQIFAATLICRRRQVVSASWYWGRRCRRVPRAALWRR